MINVGATIFSTWRALLAPKRTIPIAVVGVPLIAAQAFFGGGIAEICLGLFMVVGFVVVGPASWRVMFPPSGALPWPVWARFAAFSLPAIALVLVVAVVTRVVLGVQWTFLTSTASLVICAALFLVGGWGLGHDIEIEGTLAQERARVVLLEKEAEHARLVALRNHLDPHFIFNTLNAIAEWCRRDGEIAERAILQLSSILRAVLAGVKQTQWPLAKERALLDSLCALHLMRDPEMFTLDVTADAGVDDTLVPPLLLLPLVENAVKHGPASGHRGRVDLRFHARPSGLEIVVENPGPYRGRREGGEGIRMVESRLALATDGRGRLTLEQISEGAEARTRATLVVPAIARTS